MCTYINIYAIESDSASNKKEILSQATTRMDLEDILLSEAGSHKGQTLCESTHLSTRAVQFIDRKQNGGCPGPGAGDGESRFNGDRISIWENEKILEVMAAQQCECA